MGSAQNHSKTLVEQHAILEKAGKLPHTLKGKKLEHYKAVDEHELSLAFDGHIVGGMVKEDEEPAKVEAAVEHKEEAPAKKGIFGGVKKK